MSTMRIRHVVAGHWVADGRLRGAAKAFFAQTTLSPEPHAVMATSNRVVLGWLRYDLSKSGEVFYAAGTWVEPEWRMFRVARDLWDHALAYVEPETVVVRTISPEGRKLVASVVRDYPSIAFRVLV